MWSLQGVQCRNPTSYIMLFQDVLRDSVAPAYAQSLLNHAFRSRAIHDLCKFTRWRLHALLNHDFLTQLLTGSERLYTQASHTVGLRFPDQKEQWAYQNSNLYLLSSVCKCSATHTSPTILTFYSKLQVRTHNLITLSSLLSLPFATKQSRWSLT